jgi:START domain
MSSSFIIKKLSFIILIFFILAFTAPLYAAEYPWQLRKTTEGISVYTRKVKDSPILEFKATMTVDAPLTKISPLFEDVKGLTSWYYQCTHSELVKDEGPQDKILYIVLHLPWPVTERDSVFIRSKSTDEKNLNISYSIQALPELIPVRKGKIRVLMIHSLWRFTSLSNGKTEIYFRQHSNPGGSIPAFLVNAMAVDTPFNSLKTLRRLIMKAH